MATLELNANAPCTSGEASPRWFTVLDNDTSPSAPYDAGYSFANGGHDIDRHEYCPVTIEDDDDPKVDSAWFSSTPADGHTYRTGEWIEVAAKFNGRAAVEGDIYLGFEFRSSRGFQYRETDYRRGSGTNTLVFGYEVDVRDRSVDYEVQPNSILLRGCTLYGVWPNGTHHREDTANRAIPNGYGEELSVDAALALFDTQGHASGIDVGNPETAEFAGPQPGGIGRHEQGSVLGVGGDGEQAHQFVVVEDFGQPGGLLGVRHVEVGIGQPQGDAIEEAQAVANGVAAFPTQPAAVVQIEEVVLDLPDLDAVGAAPIVAGESGHGAEIGLLGVLGQPANGHVVDHALAKRGHSRSP